MKVLIKKPFRDKETKALYEAGQVVDMTRGRFNKAINNLKKWGDGFVEEQATKEDETEG